MSASLPRPPSVPFPPPRAESPPLRLALRPAAGGGLLCEPPPLVGMLDRGWGHITRVAVNPTRRQPLPREVPAQGRVVKVGRFTTEQAPHKILLPSCRTGGWDPLVLPAHTSQASAAGLMATAADPAGAPCASALIAAESSRPGSGAAIARESERGAPHSVPPIMPIGQVHVSEGRRQR